MAEPAAAGSIYDLGYQRYTGPRLGRRHAILALYVQGLRSSFGLGRRPAAKIVPFALLVLALLPAAIRLGIAAATSADIDIVRPENYYTYIDILLALFVSAMAPEIIGRDQRNRTLSLYFSRALNRSDYVIARYAALTSAMLFLTLGPQVVLFIGNAFAGDDPVGFVRDNWDDIPSIIASALFVSGTMAAIALAIAAQTPRRAYATGGIIATFVITGAVGAIVADTAGRYGIFLSLFDIIRGATLWLFDASPDPDDPLAKYDFPGVVYFLVGVGLAAVAGWVLARRYAKVAA